MAMDGKMARFGFCEASSLGWGGGLLFHSILCKSVVYITLRWVYEEKNTCRSMSIDSKQKQDDKNRLLKNRSISNTEFILNQREPLRGR